MVFHTASFDESKVADTIQRLRQDVSWVAKVTRMTIPRNVASLDLVVLQPTTMKTITAGETTEPASECDGVSMPSADTGCWHHKVCYKPVDTDEDGVADLPADIRQAATEARRAEEAGKVDRAHSLYAEAVSRLMKLVGEQVSTEQALPSERSTRLEALTATFSLANPRLPDCPLTHVSSGFTELTGYTAEEVVGKNCRLLQGEESEPEQIHKMRSAVEAVTDCVVRVTNYRKDGSKFVNQSSLFAVFTSRGSCKATAQLLCVHANVTGLVRWQRCLFVWCSC